MTHVSIIKTRNGEYKGFNCVGHSGYAQAGEDIVCAAISVLTINTINAIDTFTDVSVSLETDEEQGLIRYKVLDKPTKETTLLLETMCLGLSSMVEDENYAEYIDLKFEEV